MDCNVLRRKFIKRLGIAVAVAVAGLWALASWAIKRDEPVDKPKDNKTMERKRLVFYFTAGEADLNARYRNSHVTLQDIINGNNQFVSD